MKKKDILFWLVIWGSIGILISAIISIMVITGSINLDRFYDTGIICDIFESDYQTPGAGIEYVSETDVFRIKALDAHKDIDLHMQEKWKYITIVLSKLNVEELHCRIVFLDEEKTETGTQDVVFKEGKNCIETASDIKYSEISLLFWEINYEFFIEDLQFSTEKPVFTWSEFYKNMFFSILVYLLLSSCTIYLYKRKMRNKTKVRDWYAIVDGLQQFYCAVNACAGKGFCKKSDKVKSFWRVALFLIMLVYMQIMANFGLYETDQWYKICVLVCTIIIFFLALLCTEEKLYRVNWRNKLVGGWCILWILACLSDFLVKKRYAFTGYVMFFFLGFFFFMWNNMKDRSRIIKEFMTAVKWDFILNVIFCLLCRPEVEGTRYIGGYYNPGMFAMHLLYIWLVILQEIEDGLQAEKKLIYFFPKLMAGGILWTFLWKTQSSSGIIPAILAGIIFAIKVVLEKRKKTAMLFIAAIVFGTAAGTATGFGINTIPYVLNTEVEFKQDIHIANTEMPFAPVKVYADGIENSIRESRIFQKLFYRNSIERFTTGRTAYWMGYIREMNLFGHGVKVRLWGVRRWPHNGFISTAYNYGVFALIPYCVMVISCVFYSWKYFLRKKRYGMFIFSGNVCSFILILMENLELPFLFLCWFFMYMMMGILFAEGDDGASDMSDGI